MLFQRAGRKPDWKMTDMHCHILPGLDDGAQDISESISMLRLAAAEGISDMIVTPHFRAGRFSASPETVLQRLRQLREAADAEQIPIRLYPGSEIYYFDGMEACLRQGQLCTMNETVSVLVEFSPFAMLRTMQNAMDRILSAGYQPVLAHAERYACLTEKAEDAALLHDMGAGIQVNASAVTGRAGEKEKRFAHHLLKESLVDYIATDAHGCRRRTPALAQCREHIIRKYGEAYAYRIMCGNAGEMFGLEKRSREEKNI